MTANELMGFVLYKPNKITKPGISVSVRVRGIILSNESLAELEYPDCVNIYFDEIKKRMLVIASEEGNENIFYLRLGSPRRKIKSNINNVGLRSTISRIAEIDDISGWKFPGKRVSAKHLIFDLANGYKIKEVEE